MPVEDVTSRISAIEAQFASLASFRPSRMTNGALFTVPSRVTPSGAPVSTATLGSFSDGSTADLPQLDGGDVVALAKKYVGTRYVAGGNTPESGWDCAAFVQWVYGQYGIELKDVSWEQISQGTKVESLAEAKPGDLIMFHVPSGHRHDPSGRGINHVAMYIGDNKIVEAANPSAGTRITDMPGYEIIGIRRIVDTPDDGVDRTPAQLRQAQADAAAQAVAQSLGLPTIGTLDSAPAANAPVSTAGAVSAARATDPTGKPNGSARLSPTELNDVLRQAGFTGEGLRTAWALAMRESGGRPGAVSPANRNGTIDHGLFQINDVHRKSGWIDFSRIYDADYAAKVAFRMSDGGTNFSAWALGDTGWAGHLKRTAPTTYAQLYSRFRDQYDDYPAKVLS